MESFYETIDNYDQHQEYYDLMEEYSEEEIFNEVLLFMDEAFPEWKTHAGIGSWSAELMSDMLSFYAYSDRNRRDVMIDLYTDLSATYESKKDLYATIHSMQLINDFENEFEYELEEKEHLSENEYSAFYDLLFDKYKEEKMNEEVYNFRDTFVIT